MQCMSISMDYGTFCGQKKTILSMCCRLHNIQWGQTFYAISGIIEFLWLQYEIRSMSCIVVSYWHQNCLFNNNDRSSTYSEASSEVVLNVIYSVV